MFQGIESPTAAASLCLELLQFRKAIAKRDTGKPLARLGGMRGSAPFLRDNGHPAWSAIAIVLIGLALVFAAMPLMVRL